MSWCHLELLCLLQRMPKSAHSWKVQPCQSLTSHGNPSTHSTQLMVIACARCLQANQQGYYHGWLQAQARCLSDGRSECLSSALPQASPGTSTCPLFVSSYEHLSCFNIITCPTLRGCTWAGWHEPDAPSKYEPLLTCVYHMLQQLQASESCARQVCLHHQP